MDQVTAGELRAALTRAAHRPAARQELVRLLRALPSTSALAEAVRAWVADGADSSDADGTVHTLAELLVREAASLPSLTGELRRWLRDTATTDTERATATAETGTADRDRDSKPDPG
ncbi:hypothetical protein, partial [Streptomyces spongiae]